MSDSAMGEETTEEESAGRRDQKEECACVHAKTGRDFLGYEIEMKKSFWVWNS